GDTRPAIEVYTEATLERIRQALKLRGLHWRDVSLNQVPHSDAGTVFYRVAAPSATHTPEPSFLLVDVDYVHLRTLGVGLPPTALSAVKDAHMAVVGRIANFPGVTAASARAVLDNLKAVGVSLVIFNGDDVLGYRGLEKQ